MAQSAGSATASWSLSAASFSLVTISVAWPFGISSPIALLERRHLALGLLEKAPRPRRSRPSGRPISACFCSAPTSSSPSSKRLGRGRDLRRAGAARGVAGGRGQARGDPSCSAANFCLSAGSSGWSGACCSSSSSRRCCSCRSCAASSGADRCDTRCRSRLCSIVEASSSAPWRERDRRQHRRRDQPDAPARAPPAQRSCRHADLLHPWCLTC